MATSPCCESGSASSGNCLIFLVIVYFSEIQEAIVSAQAASVLTEASRHYSRYDTTTADWAALDSGKIPSDLSFTRHDVADLLEKQATQTARGVSIQASEGTHSFLLHLPG